MPRRHRRFDIGRRRFLIAGATGTAVVLAAAFSETYGFRVTRHGIGLPGLAAPLRVALLTDLHFGPFIPLASVRDWVRATAREAPDLIVVAGDLVDYRSGRDPSGLVAALARLRAPLGSYAVWGNHDHRHFHDPAALAAFGDSLGRHGIEVLTNRNVVLRSDVVLAGIDDLRTGRPDLPAALAGRPAGACTLLVSHNPDILPQVPADVALTLSGHTHGGQVCLPGIGPIVTNSRYGRRFAAGLVHGPALGYVSRGLGVTGIPLRIDCPAELAILDLTPLAPTAPDLDPARAEGA